MGLKLGFKEAYENSYAVGIGPTGNLKRLTHSISGPYAKLQEEERLRKYEESKKEKKETKTASTKKDSQNNNKDASITINVNSNNPSTTATTSTEGGYMDWMTSEYGGSENNPADVLKTTPFDRVWDSDLAKIDTGVVLRYYKNNLQTLVNAYNEALANNVGQKRT